MYVCITAKGLIYQNIVFFCACSKASKLTAQAPEPSPRRANVVGSIFGRGRYERVVSRNIIRFVLRA